MGLPLRWRFCGDSAQAHKIEAELEKRYPDYTSVQFSYLPALRALEALNRGDPVKALEMTQAAAPYELAVPGTAFYSGVLSSELSIRSTCVASLIPEWAAIARQRPSFKRFWIIRESTLNDPIGPMARLQLARALSASGDRAKSAAVYKDLLSLWKDADPDIPVVQEAKAESAKTAIDCGVTFGSPDSLSC